MISLALLAAALAAGPAPKRLIVYKQVGPLELKLHVFEPAGHRPGDRTPAAVFFFGGGWVGGTPTKLYPQCNYLARRGMWAASAEYRVKSRNHTTPAACVEDGKSAIRYVRGHARELGIDPDRIVASGASAGGQVAAATATVDGFNAPTDNLAISPVPDALVLFNPVYDNGPGGYGYQEVAAYWRAFSPMNHIHRGMPPAIVFFGRQDKYVPTATAEKFQRLMRAAGSRSELYLYPGVGHGFFNAGLYGNKYFDETMRRTDAFLVSLGYLAPQSVTDRERVTR